MPGGYGDYKAEGDESNLRNAILSASWRQGPATQLKMFDLETSDVDAIKAEDRDDADTDQDKETSQADDGSKQTVEDLGHCRFDLGTSDVDGYKC